MMGWHYGGMGWAGWLVMSLVAVALWGLVVIGLVAIFRTSRDTGPATGAGRRDPTETLDERFARGELDTDEYLARLDVLRGSSRGRVIPH